VSIFQENIEENKSGVLLKHRVYKSSTVVKTAARCCKTRIMKRWGGLIFGKIGGKGRVCGHESLPKTRFLHFFGLHFFSNCRIQ